MTGVSIERRSATSLPERSSRRVVLHRLGVPLLSAHVADTFLSRLRGLHALPSLGPDEALLIAPCNAVQTWRMRYGIDVLFLDRDGLIIEIRTLAPGSSARCRRARRVVEMATGTARRLALDTCQRLLPPEGHWR